MGRYAAGMPRTATELHHDLDAGRLAEIRDLIEQAAAADGQRPLGEHKEAHLEAGATGWSGAFAYDEQRRLVGYAHGRWNAPGSRPRLVAEYVTHPSADRDAVGARLLEAVEGVLAAAGGGILWLWVHRVEDPRDTLAARLGFAIQRELAYMTRPLRRRPDAGPPPPGVVLRAYRGETDDEEFLRVNNVAFAGHPENGGWDAAEFADRRSREWFDPDGLLLAWRGDELLGFHWTKRHGAGEPVGEVYVLAVHPAAQGQRLGRYLLDAGLAHLHDRGCRRAELYVDTASAGAVRLYAGAGFTPAHHEVCYERAVEAPLEA